MTRPVITIDPAVRFGRPQIRGITTDRIAELVWAGETLPTITDDYGLTRHEILLACWWEWRHLDRRTRRGRWLTLDLCKALAGWRDAPSIDDIPDPPTRKNP